MNVNEPCRPALVRGLITLLMCWLGTVHAMDDDPLAVLDELAPADAPNMAVDMDVLRTSIQMPPRPLAVRRC